MGMEQQLLSFRCRADVRARLATRPGCAGPCVFFGSKVEEFEVHHICAQSQ